MAATAAVSTVGVGDTSLETESIGAVGVGAGLGVGVGVGLGVAAGVEAVVGVAVGFVLCVGVAGLTVGFGVAGLGVAVGFGVAGLAGGRIPGGDAAPGEPSSENDQPSTLPGGGVRVPAPSVLTFQVPPRDACQYDQ